VDLKLCVLPSPAKVDVEVPAVLPSAGLSSEMVSGPQAAWTMAW